MEQITDVAMRRTVSSSSQHRSGTIPLLNRNQPIVATTRRLPIENRSAQTPNRPAQGGNTTAKTRNLQSLKRSVTRLKRNLPPLKRNVKTLKRSVKAHFRTYDLQNCEKPLISANHNP